MKRRERQRSRRLWSDERGAALPLIAGALALLLGLSAFAVDLGWLYLNRARLQRAADAAALAGVIHLPSNTEAVDMDTASAAAANGFPVGGNTSLSWTALDDNKLQVTMGSTAPGFFSRVMGFETFSLSATATAEYVKPVPMGSPSSCFGVGGNMSSSVLNNAGLGHCSSFTQNFWAAINGPLTAKEHGDPFAVRCYEVSSGSCSGGSNSDYRAAGYYYAVEIPSGKNSFTVKLYDAGFYARRNFQTETGDGDGLAASANGGMTTHYQLYAPDSTPLDPTDNSSISGCSLTIRSGQSSGTYKNRWVDLCTVSPPSEGGLYVLRVWSTENQGGNNSYSIGVTTNPASGARARVYGINDMSIFTNGTTGTATVYLAEIDPIHAGKKLELRFYDPGENNNNAWVEVKRPDGTTPNCSWFSEDDGGTQTDSGSGQCRIQSTISGNARFNGQWLTAIIDIPSTYTCSTDCFWKMALDMDGSQDRTTWTARVIGNPVRLVPNE